MTRRTLCAEQGSLKRRQMYGASGAKPSLFSWSSKLMIILRCAGVRHFGRPRLSFARRFPARRAMAFRNPDSDRPSRLAAPRTESPFRPLVKLRAALMIAGQILGLVPMHRTVANRALRKVGYKSALSFVCKHVQKCALFFCKLVQSAQSRIPQCNLYKNALSFLSHRNHDSPNATWRAGQQAQSHRAVTLGLVRPLRRGVS